MIMARKLAVAREISVIDDERLRQAVQKCYLALDKVEWLGKGLPLTCGMFGVVIAFPFLSCHPLVILVTTFGGFASVALLIRELARPSLLVAMDEARELVLDLYHDRAVSKLLEIDPALKRIVNQVALIPIE
jgi:hypothetical protein